MANTQATPKQISYAQSLAAQLETLEAGASSSVVTKSAQDYADGTWSKSSISNEINRLKDRIDEISRKTGVVVNAASEKQINFARSLLAEGFEALVALASDPDVIRVTEQTVFSDFEKQAKTWTKSQASKWIDKQLELNRAVKAQVAKRQREGGIRLKRAHETTRKLQPGTITQEQAKALVGEHQVGWYATDDKRVLTLVKPARSGQIVAYRVSLSEFGRDITYLGKRGLQGLKPEDKLSAKALGDLVKLLGYSFCINCGRTLTDPESIDAGIGPICAGKV